jgi:hypothetical protein
MAVHNQNAGAQITPNQQSGNKPGDGIKPSIIRLINNVNPAVASSVTVSEESLKSVYKSGEERAPSEKAVDAFSHKELSAEEQKLAEKSKEQTENIKAARLLENGKNFASAQFYKDKTLLTLLDEAIPEDVKQAIKDQSGGESDPKAVFDKAQNNPVKVAGILKDIFSPYLSEKLEEAKKDGDQAEQKRLEAIMTNVAPIFNIIDMQELGKPQHMALLGHISDLSERGGLSPKVAALVEKFENSYQKLAEGENRINGVLDKINKSVLAVANVGPKGDKQLRNLVSRLTGAAISDYFANGQVFSYDDDKVMSHSVPYETQFNFPVRRLLPGAIATAMNRIYVGTLTEDQPFASLVMKDTDDRWIPNHSKV